MIKLCAFELDYVLWNGKLGASQGRGATAQRVYPGNLRLKPSDSKTVEDTSNPNAYVTLNADVGRVLQDLERNDIIIAITSNNGDKQLCDRALWLLSAPDKYDTMQRMTTFVKYDENGPESKLEMLKQLRTWSGIAYSDMLLFDLNCTASQQVQQELGVNVKVLDQRRGLTWTEYVEALQDPDSQRPPPTNGSASKSTDPPPPAQELLPYADMPSLGRLLGSGAFADVYQSPSNRDVVIKRLKYWKPEFHQRFVTIYAILDSGHPFEPDISRDKQDEEFLSMIALELRNLRAVGELIAPLDPERFCGWFSIRFLRGRPIWDHPDYRRHPFSVPFQTLVKRAFHLTVDEIEAFVRKGGMEHRDAHLANVKFTMEGGHLDVAHIFDWGFAARMTWDGRRYIRASDALVWNSGEAGAAYTPQEFRRYWIEWMVKTEYEAQISRNSISQEDGARFLNDLQWWFEPQ